MPPKKSYLYGSGSSLSTPKVITSSPKVITLQQEVMNKLQYYEREYAKQYPTRYKILKELRGAFKETYSQFPEAFCPEASKAIFHLLEGMSVVCGKFHKFNHCWVHDDIARCNVDITFDQFIPRLEIPLVIIPDNDSGLLHDIGYILPKDGTDLNDIYDGEFENLSAQFDACGITLDQLIDKNEVLQKAHSSRQKSGGKSKRAKVGASVKPKPRAIKQVDVLRAFADGLDASKAKVVRDILQIMCKAFESEGEPDAVDWMDNDVAGFWSPGYRVDLNKAGQKLWDAVSQDITDGSDEAVTASSVDKIVLFLFRCPARELTAFHKALIKGKQEDTNVYKLKLRPGLESYLAKKPRPKAAKAKQRGGANTNAAVLQYIDGLKHPRRFTALKAMIAAAIQYNGKNPMYYIVESAAKAQKLDREAGEALRRSLLVDADNLTVVSAEKLVRYLLNVPVAVTHAVRKDMEREAAKKAKLFAEARVKVRG